jgi:hypothetical protein
LGTGDDLGCQNPDLHVRSVGASSKDVEGLLGATPGLGDQDTFGLFDDRQGLQSGLQTNNDWQTSRLGSARSSIDLRQR